MMTRMQLKQRRRRMTVLCVAVAALAAVGSILINTETLARGLTIIGAVAASYRFLRLVEWVGGDR